MLVLALFLATLAPVSKASATLTQRVDASSFICIGTVEEVIKVPRPNGASSETLFDMPTSLDFARIRVERVIKGDPTTKVVYHEAWRTWTCDDTRTTVGERTLFLLAPGQVSKMTGTQRETVEFALSSKTILRNVFDGDGIIAIRGGKDREFVHCHPCPETWAHPDEPHATSWKRVLDYVEALVPFSPEVVALLAERRGATGFFDLRVLPDGRRRFAIDGAREETVTVDRYEPVSWTQLQAALQVTLAQTDWLVGSDHLWNARQLRVRTGRNTLVFFEAYDFDRSAVPDVEKFALAHALEAWIVVRDALDCATCIDDRASDRKFLSESAK